jgi:hypothetical protein
VWGDGVPAPGPERCVPPYERRLDVSAPPSSLDWDRLTVEAVEAVARTAPLLARLGAPTPCDAGVERLRDWDEWGGPETEDSGAYMRLLSAFGNPVERAARGLHRPEIEADTRALGELVRARVTEVLPEPPDQDPWHGPTAAATEVAWIAGQVRSHAALGWPVPDDLRSRWGWIEAGHWPCALRGERLRVF